METLKTWAEVGVGTLDDDETISFKTYKNYLISLANIIKREYGGDEFSFEQIVKNLNIGEKLERNKAPNIEKIKTILFNCWHTELNFILPLTIGPSFMKYSIHWSPVQGYYSLYLSIRALLESLNNSINPNHSQTLEVISEFICKRKLFPYPWSCSCLGLAEINNLKFNCFLKPIEEISMLAIPIDKTLESCYAKFLKTTRERQFQKRRNNTTDIKTKKGNIKKNWSINDKKKVESRIANTTIFDCIYRLRIKSNYEEVDTYIFSDITNLEIEEFYNSLKLIIESTLFIMEFLMVKSLLNFRIGFYQ